jgi:hypothetical protein
MPFILFTGRGREEVVIEAINNGANFYLQKGGNPVAQYTELAHKIRIAVNEKRAEDQLTDSQRRIDDMTNFPPDAVFGVHSTGTVTACNQATEEMPGGPDPGQLPPVKIRIYSPVHP